MPLLVKTRIGETIMLGLEARATIGTAKVLIQGTDGIPPAQQRLIFAGKTRSCTRKVNV